MRSPQRNGFVLGLAALASVVGLIDAGLGGSWDLAGMFGLVTALQLVVLLQLRTDRQIGLRPDVARWVSGRAEATGEPPERVADRAVAAYRAGLVADPPGEPGGPS